MFDSDEEELAARKGHPQIISLYRLLFEHIYDLFQRTDAVHVE